MKEKYIFTIPVYVCSEEEYEIKRDKYFQSQLKRYKIARDIEAINLFEQAFIKNLWRFWKYNQIIGYIELFIWGKDIRGEFYFVNSKSNSIL